MQAAEVVERQDPDSDISRIMMAGKLATDFPAADQPDELSTQARGWQLKVQNHQAVPAAIDGASQLT